MTPRSLAISIVARIAGEHGVAVERVFSKSTHAAVLRARHQSYCDIALHFRQWPITHIAKFFSRHHSSVINSYRRFGYPHDGFRPANIRKPPRQIRQDMMRDDTDTQEHLKSSSVPNDRSTKWNDRSSRSPGEFNQERTA